MYKNILVPVDLGDKVHGQETLAIAEGLVDESGQIILFNVVEDIPTYVSAELPASILDGVQEQAQQGLEEMATGSVKKIIVDVHRGSAASAIVAKAEADGCDLIIIASHRPGLADYFLGSTAARVVRHANCPVLVDR